MSHSVSTDTEQADTAVEQAEVETRPGKGKKGKPAKVKGDKAKKTKGEKSPPTKKARGKNKNQAPGLPTVNILSPWVFERLAIRRLRRRFALGAFVLVLVIAAAWSAQHLRIRQAQQVLDVESAETTRLTAQTNELAPVRAFVTGIDQQKKTVQDTMTSEIYFSRVLEGIQRDAPLGAVVTSLQVTLAPAAAVPAAAAGEPAEAAVPVVSPCPGPDPFNTKVVVGCITISGSAATRADVGAFVIALGDDELFVEPFISTTTTADGSEVTFSGSVGLSEKVYSGRYADLDKLLGTGATG